CLVRTLSADKPVSICRCAPISGAEGPALAQQIMVSPSRRAIAAPEAPVMYCARSASNCNAASRSRCAISLSDLPPSSPGKRSGSRASAVSVAAPVLDPEDNDPEDNDPEDNDPEDNDPEEDDPEDTGAGADDPETVP